MPFWAKAKNLQGSTINARIETVATKNSFRAAFKKRRCVVPMVGYYEWSIRDVDGKKDAWFIHADGLLLAAALWEDTSPLLPDGNLGTFTTITGDSSGVSADIHDRMPVWIDPGQLDAWLTAEPDDAMAILLASKVPPHGGVSRRPSREHPAQQHRAAAAAGGLSECRQPLTPPSRTVA